MPAFALDLSAAEREEKLELVLERGRSAGFIRTIADEGPALATALADALRRQPADSYADTLAPVLERTAAAATTRNVPLFGGVMLSDRELTVLKYLATRPRNERDRGRALRVDEHLPHAHEEHLPQARRGLPVRRGGSRTQDSGSSEVRRRSAQTCKVSDRSRRRRKIRRRPRSEIPPHTP